MLIPILKRHELITNHLFCTSLQVLHLVNSLDDNKFLIILLLSEINFREGSLTDLLMDLKMLNVNLYLALYGEVLIGVDYLELQGQDNPSIQHILFTRPASNQLQIITQHHINPPLPVNRNQVHRANLPPVNHPIMFENLRPSYLLQLIQPYLQQILP